MSRVSDTWEPHSRAIFRVTCTDFAMVIFKATPYSLVYGMETVLPVEIEMGSLRVALEQQISDEYWDPA
ncbi:hypothetical protein CK203_040347 [Vitis vinifera]|uniref:Uncharacterized protein n=1 Tax=Vitis vinifera TaxID=29760 RepID=A0A438FX22_VITVI|nr:hypothetical protein CK203_040347 [Vitis vinifera]